MMRALLILTLLAGAAHAGSEIKVTDGKLKEAQMPPEPQDRSQASKAAAAAAAAGAAQGTVTCMMMMNEARKEEDKKAKVAMMAMAGQQCAQATALQISAIQNNKNNNKLSANDIPKPASFTAGKTTIENKNDEQLLTFDESAPVRGTDSAKGEIPVSEVAVPGFAKAATTQSPGELPADLVQAASGNPAPPASPLSPIKPGSLEFEDGGKATGGTAVAGGGMGFAAPSSGGSGGKNSESSQASASSDDGDAQPVRRSRASSNDVAAGGGGSSGGSDDGGGKGDDTLDALMAQLNGGPAEGELGDPGAGSQISAGEPTATSDRANIFEYATIRFSKLTGEKRLGGKAPAIPERALASAKP